MSILQAPDTGRAGDPLFRKAHSFAHPDQVVDDQELTLADKRAVLASWASDALAVEDQPSLRQLPSGAIVPVEDILAALKSLDLDRHAVLSFSKSFARRRVNSSLKRPRVQPDDDDEPPPFSGRAAIPVARKILTGTRPLQRLTV
jgi:hypothetical protein